MTNTIIACLDGSAMSTAVADAAGWVSQTLSAPLLHLHVLEPGAYADTARTQSNRGSGTEGDVAPVSRRARGQQVLDVAQDRVRTKFDIDSSTRLVEGSLLEILRDYRDNIRVLVVGKRGETAADGSLGENLTQMIRATHRPTMIVNEDFQPPKKVMIAFDGSETMIKAVNTIAQSPLFQALECHVVMVGSETDEHTKQLRWAEKTLLDRNIATHAKLIVEKEFQSSLNRYATEFDIGMMVMGAYSHNQVWQLVMGSNTAKLLLETRMTLLVLR